MGTTDRENKDIENKGKVKAGDTKWVARFMAKAAIIAAVYAVLTIVVMPLSYGVMQLRVSEAMTVLPVFTSAAIPGLFIGCVAANLVSPVGAVDIVIGSAATLLAAICTYKLKSNRLLALFPPVIFNAVFVGAELYYFYNVDFSLIACMLWVGAGEAIVCYGLGYPLSLLLDKHRKELE